MNKRIHILTATYGDQKNLKRLLSAIAKQTCQPSSVTVVNHGLDQGIAKLMHDYYPSTHYIRGSKKLWWTGALNLGITDIFSRSKDTDYLLTINTDCQVDPTYLESIVAQTNPHTIVNSRAVDYKTGKTWDNGIRIDWEKGKIFARQSADEPIDAVTTKGTLYPLSMFKHIGLLAKQLPHYVSDYELSIRAKREGYHLRVCEDCVVRNDTTNTGIGDEIPPKISYKDSFKLMFNRKSKLNIVDQFWFINLACPTKYKIINYLRLLAKATYLLVLPIPPLHSLLKSLRQRYNTRV